MEICLLGGNLAMVPVGDLVITKQFSNLVDEDASSSTNGGTSEGIKSDTSGSTDGIVSEGTRSSVSGGTCEEARGNIKSSTSGRSGAAASGNTSSGTSSTAVGSLGGVAIGIHSFSPIAKLLKRLRKNYKGVRLRS
ncbi:hypothetical protein AXG93_4022s1220 [Marchantia polymorpha subsp. ruderalis]|uniref:Uncharacterized protein n=1 Tax=Marchantia polymorpha subsp. ruderalis TaxID=1480154 RepID=A0A176VZ72_MARPO|nr:hypothetical protein AXG93_4022s1220 [Marchantia polymorpha subsp. ruderalis]